MPPKKLTQREKELCTNADNAMQENPKKAGEVDWWKKNYSKDLAEAMKVDPENDCSCAWAKACDDKLENERAYFTSDAHVAACKKNLHSVTNRNAVDASKGVQTFACKTCNKKPLANICMCDGGTMPKKMVRDKKTMRDKEVTDWFVTGAWGFGILKCKHCLKPCFMFNKTPEAQWLDDGQRSDHRYLRGNTPVLGRSSNNLYAGVDTPASAFPQPVVTNRSEEQQKQYEDMFTKLDQNLRKEFATLADTERLAMQSPREKNKNKGSPSFADSIKLKKDRQAERIAKLNETEEELQKEIEEKKKQEELAQQPGLPDDNTNHDDDDDDDDDETNHEIAKQHQTAEKSYKNLAQAFDEFVGL